MVALGKIVVMFSAVQPLYLHTHLDQAGWHAGDVKNVNGWFNFNIQRAEPYPQKKCGTLRSSFVVSVGFPSVVLVERRKSCSFNLVLCSYFVHLCIC